MGLANTGRKGPSKASVNARSYRQKKNCFHGITSSPAPRVFGITESESPKKTAAGEEDLFYFICLPNKEAGLCLNTDAGGEKV